jgi:hypothetical protein
MFRMAIENLIAERTSSPAAAAGETLKSEKPQCRRSQVQLMVRRRIRRHHTGSKDGAIAYQPSRAQASEGICIVC